MFNKLITDLYQPLEVVETGLCKTRVDVVLSALRTYEPFKEKWKKRLKFNPTHLSKNKNKKPHTENVLHEHTNTL